MPELEMRSTNGLREGIRVNLQMSMKFGLMGGKGIQLFALLIAICQRVHAKATTKYKPPGFGHCI